MEQTQWEGNFGYYVSQSTAQILSLGRMFPFHLMSKEEVLSTLRYLIAEPQGHRAERDLKVDLLKLSCRQQSPMTNSPINRPPPNPNDANPISHYSTTGRYVRYTSRMQPIC